MDIPESKISWGHNGTWGKWHVDIIKEDGTQDHGHSPTINPPPRDEDGAIRIKGDEKDKYKNLPPPYGPIPE